MGRGGGQVSYTFPLHITCKKREGGPDNMSNCIFTKWKDPRLIHGYWKNISLYYVHAYIYLLIIFYSPLSYLQFGIVAVTYTPFPKYFRLLS